MERVGPEKIVTLFVSQVSFEAAPGGDPAKAMRPEASGDRTVRFDLPPAVTTANSRHPDYDSAARSS
jgi:hypothetical protein